MISNPKGLRSASNLLKLFLMKKYFIKTYGCQMNEADSERIAGWYEVRGWKAAKSLKEADEVVINTCSVRQTAEDRVFGLVKNLNKLKIILTGCMLYHPIADLKRKLPLVDEFKKTNEFLGSSQLDNLTIRDSKSHAWVPIMEGCNNFCAYCVVPYARGREKSRPFEEIICEVKELVRRGYREITLLGQNVNSYGKDIKIISNSRTYFALLLAVLNGISGLKKISFLTSNPWDLDDEIIEAMKLPKVDRYLHLPVQSGDDEVLRRMNRHYTAKQYLSLINKIRKKIPDIKIGTDIIVGFPGETKKQFKHTVDLCKKVSFAKAYIAMYSPRPGTAAYKLKDDVPHGEKKRRWKILEELINKKK
jgi:tRNA-2-methylthio-N6-dimethylallyladenosine synthase